MRLCLLALPALLLLARGQNLEVTSALGTKFYSLPDNKGVVAAAQKAAAGDPQNPGLLLKLAQAQASIWQEGEAAETCTRALALSPKSSELYTERGHRELPLREFARARADLQKAVALDPKNMQAWYHLGLAHYFLGDFAAASDAFGQAANLAPNIDERINSTNWVYAASRRAGKTREAAAVLAQITPGTKNTAEHTWFYLSLLRFFQGAMAESDVVPPPPTDPADTEAELRFDTVAYGVGNWHLYNGHAAEAQEYFRRVAGGRVWITWGFIGAETELARNGTPPRLNPR